MTDKIPYVCSYCHIGHYQPSQATYMRMIGNMPVSVPDVLLWTCDVCGFQEFDREAVMRIEALIGESEPTRAPDRKGAKRSQPDTLEADNVRRLKP